MRHNCTFTAPNSRLLSAQGSFIDAMAGRQCAGKDAQNPCRFSATVPGQPAAPHAGNRCVLCSQELFQAALTTPTGRGSITRFLKKFHAGKHTSIKKQALKRIKEWAPDEAATFEKKSCQAARKKRTAADKKKGIAAAWKESLARRKPAFAAPDRTSCKQFRRVVLDDQRCALKNFFPDPPRKPRAAPGEEATIPDNGTELPATKNPLSQQLENWSTKGSWGMCPKCHRLMIRRLQQKDLERTDFAPHIAPSTCRWCKGKTTKKKPSRAPGPLRDLTKEIVHALRPLNLDVGVEIRAPQGYRKKMRMCTFYWSLESVSAKVAALEGEAKRKAQTAFRFLKKNKRGHYRHIHQKHLEFLKEHKGQLTQEVARRPLSYIEEPGLEMAMWPQLYWKQGMCPSVERMSGRRLERYGGSRSKRATDAEGPEDRRRFMARLFLSQAFSPHLGYNADFELLQYIYDLHLYTMVGSKKHVTNNTAAGVPMRVMMKGHTISPLFWEEKRFGLQDLVRQLGFPQLYVTFAPYERCFPYHVFVQDEMKKLHRGRMGLPVMETLHMSHVMMEVCHGLLAGKGAGGWTENLLGTFRTASDGTPYFARIEYQDGSRKRGTQKYHGSGRPHVHALFWVKDMEAASLVLQLNATMDAEVLQDENMAAYVRGSQLDDKGDSRWDVHDEPSTYDRESKRLKLYHTAEDAAAGVRGYFPAIMGALKCHQDVQTVRPAEDDGRGLLLKYVAKYVAKFSDSSYDEWFSDSASVMGIARKVLFEYHPLEPEMALQLAGSICKQWEMGTASGGMTSFRVPKPTEEPKDEVVRYIHAGWRRDDMSLLEYLRKTGKDGQPAQWLRKRHEQYVQDQEERGEEPTPLKNFANDYLMAGEQVVAAHYLWRLNNDYFGQWLLMNYPFRRLDTFQLAEVDNKVPARYRWLATALCLTDRADAGALRNHWRDMGRIRVEMELEGHAEGIIVDTMTFIQGCTLAVDGYLSGRRKLEDELDQEAEQPAPSRSGRGCGTCPCLGLLDITS